jgi:hypothetical protein
MRSYVRLGVLLFLFSAGCFGTDVFVTTAQGQTFTISGKITQPPSPSGTPIADVSVVLTVNGSTQSMTQTDGSGNFSFSGVAAGSNFLVTPTKPNFEFNPVSQSGTNIQGDKSLFFTGAIVNSNSFQFSAAATSVSEGTPDLTVTVIRSGDASAQASVDYTTGDNAGSNACSVINGNASSRCDYITSLGTLTFAANETSKNISIPIIDDVYAEGNEDFTIILSNGIGATVGTTAAETLTINDNDTVNGTTNPIDGSTFFVRQHYLDFLSREPDTDGLAFWINGIESCGSNTQCRELKRVNASAAFFLSIEFQETGYLVYRVHKTGLGNLAGKPVPVRFLPFLGDTQQIGQGVRVGIGNWQAQLESNKQAYALAFVQRPAFLSAFPESMTADQIVTKMDQNAGGVLSAQEKSNLVAVLGATPADTVKRASVLRSVAEDADLKAAETSKAFVLMQYFGYMRRNPDDAPDSNFSGYDFWLSKLNSFGGNFVNAEMVKAFIQSDEYRHRFALQ